MLEDEIFATLRLELEQEGYNEEKIEALVLDFPMDYLLSQFWKLYDEQLDGTIDRYTRMD